MIDQISTLASRKALTIGIAESLTGGQIAAALASGDDAAEWFRGSIVAYVPEVKFEAALVESR